MLTSLYQNIKRTTILILLILGALIGERRLLERGTYFENFTFWRGAYWERRLLERGTYFENFTFWRSAY